MLGCSSFSEDGHTTGANIHGVYLQSIPEHTVTWFDRSNESNSVKMTWHLETKINGNGYGHIR